MKIYRTTIPFSEAGYVKKIDYDSHIMLVGSCFTENIGSKLGDMKFPTAINPFGILYNPVSIRNCLSMLARGQKMDSEALVQYNGLWHSLNHHGKFSHKEKALCIKNINENIEKSAAFLQETHYLFITFGTAWVYEWRKNEEIVANCHKIPDKFFERKLLNVDTIVAYYELLIKELNKLNPNLRIVFSISPIRHLKDGAVENQLSKATLVVAAHKIAAIFANVSYFPAYELLMDDLRDYRFYTPDMIHLNELAVDYIWEYFAEVFFDDETRMVYREIAKIHKAMKHRPSNSDSDDYQKFKRKNLEKTKALNEKYPFLNLEEERSFFE